MLSTKSQLLELVDRYVSEELEHGQECRLKSLVFEIEQAAIMAALRKTKGGKRDAANLLGINRNTLRAKMSWRVGHPRKKWQGIDMEQDKNETKLFRVIAIGDAILFAGVRNEDLTFTQHVPSSEHADRSELVEEALVKCDQALLAARHVLGLTAKEQSSDDYWVIDTFLKPAGQSEVSCTVVDSACDKRVLHYELSLEEEAEIRRLLDGIC